jgi:hypothetical protein
MGSLLRGARGFAPAAQISDARTIEYTPLESQLQSLPTIVLVLQQQHRGPALNFLVGATVER